MVVTNCNTRLSGKQEKIYQKTFLLSLVKQNFEIRLGGGAVGGGSVINGSTLSSLALESSCFLLFKSSEKSI